VTHLPPGLSRRGAARVTLTRRRKLVALAVAGASDVGQMVFSPAFVEGAGSPFEIALDAVTALVILLIVGFEWRLAFALAAELIPGVDIFPTWTAVVLSLKTVTPSAPVLPRALPPQERPTTPA
jgi:hypothetical protein